MRQWRTALTVIAAFTLVGVACAPQGGGGPAPAGQEKPTSGGLLIVGSFSDIQRLNPATSNDATSSNARGKIYDSLLSANAETRATIPWPRQRSRMPGS